MRKNTLIKWQTLIKQQLESDLPISKFCKLNNLSVTCFYNHKKILMAAKNADNKSSFVKVQRSTPAVTTDSIQLKYHQVMMRIPTSTEPGWLANLLKALA